MQPQTPMQEMAEAVGEEMPKLAAAAFAVGLADHRRMLDHHARRVRESHRAMARAAGMEDCLSEVGEDDEMGDIIISGDHTHYHADEPAKSAPAPAAAPSARQIATGIGKAALLATALGTGGLGAGLGALASNWLASGQPPVPSPVESSDTTLDVRLVPNE